MKADHSNMSTCITHKHAYARCSTHVCYRRNLERGNALGEVAEAARRAPHHLRDLFVFAIELLRLADIGVG